jgi:glycosyltransferase involved in cell wall biosynthesis
LQIYGEGSQYELLENLKNNPSPGWHVQIAPPISNLVETLSEFDILLFPSRFEGYGRIAAEAVLLMKLITQIVYLQTQSYLLRKM